MTRVKCKAGGINCFAVIELIFGSTVHCAVEFPAVLLNTRSGEIEAEFHQYVQPQENPILSDFCKQLTGISQVQ